MADGKIIKIVRDYLVYLRKNKYPVSLAYLFGSCAKGTNNPESDIDIALIFDELADQVDMQIQLMKLRRKFDLRIEPHPFTLADLHEKNPFVNEVIKSGILIT